MEDVDIPGTDNDLVLVAREPWHPALWGGVVAQLVAIGVLAVVGRDWYGGGYDVPLWVDWVGATTGLLALAGGFLAAWVPRRADAAPVEGAPWLRATWQVLHVTAIGFVILVVSLFTGGSSWPSVLLISAGIGTALLGLATLVLVVGPVVLITDVRRPGVRARWYDVASAAGLLPWVVVVAGSLTWAVEGPARNEVVAQWAGVVLGTVEAREPWLAWLVRATTAVGAVMTWRAAVVSRRALRARRR